MTQPGSDTDPTVATLRATRADAVPGRAAEPADADGLRPRIRAVPLEERVRLLTGATAWALHRLDALDLGTIVVSDGPIGVRGVDEETTPSAQLPSPSALAATWDRTLAARLGRLIGREARRKDVDVVLAPVINLQRTPLGGRHFECFSEDPLLTAHLAVSYVAAAQAEGVGMCVKHFIGNESETERTGYIARIDERTLREVYLAPFEAVVRDAGAWSVMAAYNRVDDGVETAFATEHRRLVVDLLKGEWGFDGVVISDWLAATSTVPTALGGLDLVMPGPDGPWGPRLVAAVRAGLVDEDAIDDKVARLLRLGRRVGAIGRADAADRGAGIPRGDGAGLPRGDGAGTPTDDVAGLPTATETRALLREVVARSSVLLRNDGVLPLGTAVSGEAGASPARRPAADGSAVSRPAERPVEGASTAGRRAPASLALIGPNALEPFYQGGGSAFVFAPYESLPADALRRALPATDIRVARGARARAHAPAIDPAVVTTPDGAPGYELTLLDPDGAPLGPAVAVPADESWNRHVPHGAATARMRARVRLEGPGVHRLELGTSGAHRIRFDGVLASQAEERAGSDVILDSSANHPAGPAVTVEVGDAAVTVEVDADLQVVDAEGYGTFVRCALRHEPHHLDPEAELAAAERLAADSEVAVVIVGTNEETESEGWDRSDLALPGGQDELVRRVARANPRTVVVVNAGAPVELPWLDEIAAVLWWWLPGQEGGNGLADALTGAVEPSGRLPWTLPARLEDCPVPDAVPVDGVVEYAEGLEVGHRGWDRAGRTPAREFGFGLGYADFDYRRIAPLGRRDAQPAAGAGSAVASERAARADDQLVSVTIANTADRDGREVVQLYLEPVDDEHDRPLRTLAGFAVADVAAGAAATVALAVPHRAFQYWSTDRGAWLTAPGRYRIRAGRSSRDLRLAAEVTVAPDGEIRPATARDDERLIPTNR